MKITHHFSSELHRKLVENGLVVDGVYTTPAEPLLLSDFFNLSVEMSLVQYCPMKDEFFSLPDGLSPEELGTLRSYSLQLRKMHTLLSDESRTIRMVESFELLQEEAPVEQE